MARRHQPVGYPLVVMAAVLLSCGFLQAGVVLEDKVLRAAVVPDADLLGTADAVAWRALPIQKALDAIGADLQARATPGSQAQAMQARLDKFAETLGIAKEDVSAVVCSARTRGLEGQAGATDGPPTAQSVLQRLGMVLGLRTAKPMSTAKIRLALSNAAAEQGMELMFEKADYKGASILAIVRPDQPGKPTPWLPRDMTIAVLDGDTAAFVGMDPDVRAAIDRWSGAAPAAFTAPMSQAQTTALPGALSSLFFVPSDSMRSKARDQGTKMQAQNPMFAGAMQALAGLQHVAFGAKGSDRISAQLGATFTSAEEALQMKTMVDAMVLGMGKMMLMQAIGRPIPLIESLTSRQEGTGLAIVADLTEEDCRALGELSLKGPQAIPGMPAGGAGPAGPVGVPAPQPVAPGN